MMERVPVERWRPYCLRLSCQFENCLRCLLARSSSVDWHVQMRCPVVPVGISAATAEGSPASALSDHAIPSSVRALPTHDWHLFVVAKLAVASRACGNCLPMGFEQNAALYLPHQSLPSSGFSSRIFQIGTISNPSAAPVACMQGDTATILRHLHLLTAASTSLLTTIGGSTSKSSSRPASCVGGDVSCATHIPLQSGARRDRCCGWPVHRLLRILCVDELVPCLPDGPVSLSVHLLRTAIAQKPIGCSWTRKPGYAFPFSPSACINAMSRFCPPPLCGAVAGTALRWSCNKAGGTPEANSPDVKLAEPSCADEA